MGEGLRYINKIWNYFSNLYRLLRATLLYRWRFGKCGRGVFFGRMNTIRGHKYIEIGDNCCFGDNMRIEAIDRWGGVSFTPKIVLGNGVFINQNFHCTCASSIVIGDGTSITANCGVFDIIHPYEDINMNPRLAEIKTKPISIGKNCLIGMNTVIMPGTQLGNHCVVGANSTVFGVFSDYSVLAGSPAHVVKRYDFVGKEWKKK